MLFILCREFFCFCLYLIIDVLLYFLMCQIFTWKVMGRLSILLKKLYKRCPQRNLTPYLFLLSHSHSLLYVSIFIFLCFLIIKTSIYHILYVLYILIYAFLSPSLSYQEFAYHFCIYFFLIFYFLPF